MKVLMKKFLIVSLCIIGLYGCKSDTLDIDPPGFPSAEGFFSTADDIEAGINGVYEVFQGTIWGGSFVHSHPAFIAATENAVDCCPWQFGITQIANGSMNSTTGSFLSWKWDYGYQGLARIHTLLEAMENIASIEDSERIALQAELRFLRAFIYSELSFLYGDVPLVLSIISSDEAREISRTPKAEVVESILTDLDFGIANLNTEPRNGDLGRPTLQAALTLKGKVLLYNNSFSEAANTFQQVINMEGSAVLLDPDYESLFNATNEESREVIWSIQYLSPTEGPGEGNWLSIALAPTNLAGTPAATGESWGSYHFTRALLDDYYMSDGLPIGTSPLYDSNDIFVNRDPRFKMSFYVPGDNYRGHTLIDNNFTVNGSQPLELRMSSRKWVDGNTDINYSLNANPQDLILMRYADVLMMYAEAQNEAVGPDASVYDAVNKVRARAGMPDFPAGLSQAQMREEIRHERKIEFVLEGNRYYDLLRWRTAETVIPSIPHLENRIFDPNKNYLWPIPQHVLDQSPNIIQNPGYN